MVSHSCSGALYMVHISGTCLIDASKQLRHDCESDTNSNLLLLAWCSVYIYLAANLIHNCDHHWSFSPPLLQNLPPPAILSTASISGLHPLLQHPKLHFPPQTQPPPKFYPLTCHLCHKGFSQRANLRGHLASVHHQEDCMVSCKTCARKFTYASILHRHIKAEHNQLYPGLMEPSNKWWFCQCMTWWSQTF